MAGPSASSTIPVRIMAASFASSLLAACPLVDDDEPDNPGPPSDTDGIGNDECLAQLEAAQAVCLPGMYFYSMVEEGDGTMVLIDDPVATIGVGPGAWLVQVYAAADAVASYQFDGGTCTVGCGWCQEGEALCHAGLDQSGVPQGCVMCIPYDTPDIGDQCAQFMDACMNPSDGLDETGSDEAGSTGAHETGDGAGELGVDTVTEEPFDCSEWESAGAVTLDARGNAVVDAAIVETIAVHYGEPLAKCDDTSFRQRPDGYFEISTMAPGGLLAQMGLQQGDIIFAVDGDPMNELGAITSTALELFLGSRVTSGFILVVRRGPDTITKAVRMR